MIFERCKQRDCGCVVVREGDVRRKGERESEKEFVSEPEKRRI